MTYKYIEQLSSMAFPQGGVACRLCGGRSCSARLKRTRAIWRVSNVIPKYKTGPRVNGRQHPGVSDLHSELSACASRDWADSTAISRASPARGCCYKLTIMN